MTNRETMSYKSVDFWKGFDDNTFSGNPLDRKDVALLESMRKDEKARFLPFHELKVLVNTSSSNRTLGWLSWAELESLVGKEISLEGQGEGLSYKENSLVLLGKLNQVPHYAINVTHILDKDSLGEKSYKLEDVSTERERRQNDSEKARALASALPLQDTGMIAQARALLDWHVCHPHCARCGGMTKLTEGGNKRVCVECKRPHYPRTDSVVIVLVIAEKKKEGTDEKEEVCLLATRAQGYKGMYTCLSGFIEIGESLEEAIKREIWYHSSQPWPFPSQLMIGCLAKTNYAEPTVDAKELGEARWMNREQVRELLSRSLLPLDAGSTVDRVPPPLAIAHQLIKFWAVNDTNTPQSQL
ncbi:nudix (nucleoside diphosphate linked moiety X)-type motif 12 [Planoprotostelium fungivorum]|uniref:Nudix (Nucleoside diphosphate linked moiety X)-type motif 12 n=1 Tax=Planoprotostelium fungivorum TaxID=1890364 RepID=A0A2P6NYD2_9EUKA|nr:nudix (nucleoside diphosphate linked moiety X)-type motif 12 [Planoprotostelium fungivorum]